MHLRQSHHQPYHALTGIAKQVKRTLYAVTKSLPLARGACSSSAAVAVVAAHDTAACEVAKGLDIEHSWNILCAAISTS
jgi:homoserine kinase